MVSNRQIIEETYHALLMEYVAGTLDMAQSLIISAHISISPRGREIVQSFECVGGALLEKSCEPVAMRKESLQNVLGHLDRQRTRAHEHARMEFPEDAHVPECVQDRVTCRTTRFKWKKLYPGISAFHIPLECQTSRAHLFKLRPGATTPRHRPRRGVELTLVLNGSMMDEAEMYNQGDLVIHEAVHERPHAQKSCAKKGCVTLSVSSGGIELTGPLSRLLNPFIRF